MLLRLLAPCRRAASHGLAARSLVAAVASNRSCSSATGPVVELKRLSAPERYIYEPASRLAAPSVVVEQDEVVETTASSSAFSSPSSSPVPAAATSTATVEHVEKAVKVDEWAWRRARGAGLFRWLCFSRYLFALRNTFHLRDLKLYRPSTWLPKGAPPFKMVERRNEDGLSYLGVSYVQSARVEDYLVSSGRASAARMAKLSLSSGLKNPGLASGRPILVADKTFSSVLGGLRRRNALKRAALRRLQDSDEPSAPVVEPGTDLSAKNPSSATAPPAASSSSSTSRPTSSSSSAAGLSTVSPVLDDTVPDGLLEPAADGLADVLDADVAVDERSTSRAPDAPTRHLPLKYYEVVKEASRVASRHFDLEAMRFAYAHAVQHGSAAFLSIDLEWRAEKRATYLTEVGWSSLEFIVDSETGKVEERRDGLQAFSVRSDRRPAPTCPVSHTLAAVIHTLSYQKQLFLIFHDPRGDLRALDLLGFDTARDFHTNLRMLEPLSADERVARVVDTQRLFSAWVGRAPRTGLDRACAELQVRTDRELFHNAGNDAHYTLALFERLMNRALRPDPTSPLVVGLSERPTAAALEELHPSFSQNEQQEVEDDEEQEREREQDDGRDEPVEEEAQEGTSASH
ncbi:hypothetical protein JCM3775_003259 [Rhodotorula graminis]